MPATRGRFIVLEGGEAVGKSTQAAKVAKHLGAVVTREPGGTVLGERVRSLLLDPEIGHIDPRAELLLMVASRAEHVASVVVPALATGRDVVCDRFEGSTLAYQGYGRGLPMEDVEAACRLGSLGIEPDVTILIDVDPAAAGTRRRADPTARHESGPDRIEAAGSAFHDRVRRGFLELAETRDWTVIDGDQEVEAVTAAILSVVEAVLI